MTTRAVQQRGLFDPPDRIPVNLSVSPVEAPRLSQQAATILARLQRGRVSVGELKQIAAQYNARIYELRAAGHDIQNVDRNKKTGESWYVLRPAKVTS